MRSLACQTAGRLAPLTTELAFLELATPTIESAVARLAAAGIRRLVTVPVLLFRAGHADRDIPDAVAAAAAEHGIQVIHQTPPLEHQSAVVQLSAERFSEALRQAGCAGTPCHNIALAMIARGSSSQSAADAMLELARLRVEQTPVGEYAVGYVAVRQPNVPQTLDWLESTAAQTLVVQPHLLFEGEVYHSLCAAVEQRRSRQANAHENGARQTGAAPRRWIVCQPLGAAADNFEDAGLAEDARLAEVLAQLVEQGLQ
jgi:sirohydrochlorin cobaltochelatase